MKYAHVPSLVLFEAHSVRHARAVGGVIKVSAPHMSFEMTVNYMRADLLRQFDTQSKAEAADKSKTEASKF